MRVLAEMGLLLVLGLALAWLVGLRSDGVFIAGLLLAVSVAGLVEWLRPAQWSWVLCTAYLVIARGGAFMVRVHAAHRLRYCTAAGPRLDRSPGWGTDCGKWPLPQCLADRRPLAVPLPMQCVRPRGFRPPRAGYGCCR